MVMLGGFSSWACYFKNFQSNSLFFCKILGDNPSRRGLKRRGWGTRLGGRYVKKGVKLRGGDGWMRKILFGGGKGCERVGGGKGRIRG